VFLQEGYSAASMDVVAARANVSKATIYAHFDGKRSLFEAVIRRHAEEAYGRMALPDQTGPGQMTDVRQILLALAREVVGLITQRDSLALYRVVLAEAVRLPEVGEAFYRAGPAYLRQQVTQLFADLARRGLLHFDQEQAALVTDLFLSMLSGDCHFRLLIGRTVTPQELSGAAAAAVDLVVARWG
jgi:TetR/AcrR family transcriptional repressor of mexJK operon